MAENATDFLTVEQVKVELAIPAAETGHDVWLGNLIAEAVDYLSTVASLPLVDRVVQVYVDPPLLKIYPVMFVLPGSNVIEVQSIGYWNTDGSLRAESNAQVAGAALGRLIRLEEGWCQYPPADGWPVRLFNSKFKLNVKQGVNATANRQIRRPIMVYIRESYDGNRDFRLAPAFQNMVDNLKDYGV